MKAPFATAIAIAIGLLVLLGYFVPVPLLLNLRTLLLGWAVILVAVATVVGVINLARVHWSKAPAKRDRIFTALFSWWHFY